MMEMDAEAAATTSNEEEDGQVAGKSGKGEMDHKQGGGSSRDLPTQAKPEAGGSTKLTDAPKSSSLAVPGSAKSTECQDTGQMKKADQSKSTAPAVDPAVEKARGSTERTSQPETTQKPAPAKSVTSSDKVSPKPLSSSVKTIAPSSSVPTELPGPSSGVPKSAKIISPNGANDAAKTTQSNVSAVSGNLPVLSAKTTANSSSGTLKGSASSSSSDSVATSVVPGKSPALSISSNTIQSNVQSKPASVTTSVTGANNVVSVEKHIGKTEAKASTNQSVTKAPCNQPSSALPTISSKPSLSRSPAISSPLVSSSTSTKPAVASSIITKSALPTASHVSRNVPSSTSGSSPSSSMISSSKTSHSSGPPFKPVPKIPPVMPSVKLKINPPKFSSLVSSSSLQKPSPSQSPSTSSASTVSKSPSSSAPKPNMQSPSRTPLSPTIPSLMSIKVTCPPEFSSSRALYSSHSSYLSGGRTSVSSPAVTSSPSNVTTSSPRVVSSSSSPQRAPAGSSRTSSQPVQSLFGNQRPATSSASSVSSSASSAPASRSPSGPVRQSPPAESPRPTSTSRLNEPQASPPRGREADRPLARPVADFSVPDVRRDCPSGPDSAPSASSVPDVLRTGSEEEDRQLERMLRPNPFGGGIPPPNMPDLCRRGGELSLVPTPQPMVPSSAEADLDLLRPASASGNPRTRMNDVVPVEPQLVVPESSSTAGNDEPERSGGQGPSPDGHQTVGTEGNSNGENVPDPPIEVSASQDNRLSIGSCSRECVRTDGSHEDDDANETSSGEASSSGGGPSCKKEELSGASVKVNAGSDQPEQVKTSAPTKSDQKESESDNVAEVKHDSGASPSTKSASCDSVGPRERTDDQSTSKSTSTLPTEKTAEKPSSGSCDLSDEKQPLITTPSDPEGLPSTASKGERMTVEKAEAGKDSLVGKEDNSTLMIPPPTANLPKVLVMADEASGRKEDHPQKEGTADEEGEKKKGPPVSTSTFDNGSSATRSHAICDKPEAIKVDKPVKKPLENIGPLKGDSDTPSSKVSPTCKGGIVPPKDCDSLGSACVVNSTASLPPEASQEIVSSPLPDNKSMLQSSSSSGQSSLNISINLEGTSVERISNALGSMDRKKDRGHENVEVKLNVSSGRDSSEDLKDKADLNSQKVTGVRATVTSDEMCGTGSESAADKRKSSEDTSSHDKSSELRESQDSSRLIRNEGDDVAAMKATGSKDFQKNVCVEKKSVIETSMPTAEKLCHDQGKLIATGASAVLTEGDSHSEKFCLQASDKKDLLLSEENKINDKHKDIKVPVHLSSEIAVKEEEKVVVEERKMPENVSLSKIGGGEGDLMNESKRSQLVDSESVSVVSVSTANAESKSISVKADGKEMLKSQIKDCEPDLLGLAKSDKNALNMVSNNATSVNSPSRVQIIDEIWKNLDKASKIGNLDNNERGSLSDGQPKGALLREIDSSPSEEKAALVPNKTDSDLKAEIHSGKVPAVVGSTSNASVESSALVKIAGDSTEQKLKTSIDKREPTNSSVNSSEKPMNKNLGEGMDKSSALIDVHSSENSESCKNVSVKMEEQIGMTVKDDDKVNQVKGPKICVSSAQSPSLDSKQSIKVVGASACGDQSDKKHDAPDKSSKKTTDELVVKAALCASTQSSSQPSQELNIVSKPVLTEEHKIKTHECDDELLQSSPKIKAVQEQSAKIRLSKVDADSDPKKTNDSDNMFKLGSEVAHASQVKANQQLAHLQCTKEVETPRGTVAPSLICEQANPDKMQEQPGVKMQPLEENPLKGLSGDLSSSSGRSSKESCSGGVSISSVPDLKKSVGDVELANKAPDTPVVTDKSKNSAPASVEVQGVPSHHPKTKEDSKAEEKFEGNIPIVSEGEVNLAQEGDSLFVKGDNGTPKSNERVVNEKSHSKGDELSKKIPDENISSVSSLEAKLDQNIVKGISKPSLERTNVNCTEKPLVTKDILEEHSEQNDKSADKEPLQKLVKSPEGKGNPERSPLPSAALLQSVRVSEGATDIRKMKTSDSKAFLPKQDKIEPSFVDVEASDSKIKKFTVATHLNNNTTSKVEDQEKISLSKSESISTSDVDSEVIPGASEMKSGVGISAELNLDAKKSADVSDFKNEGQSTDSALVLTDASLGSTMSKMETSSSLQSPIPDLLNAANVEHSNGENNLELSHKENGKSISEAAPITEKLLGQNITEKSEEAAKNVEKDGEKESGKDVANTSVKDRDEGKPSVISSTDVKNLSSDHENDTLPSQNPMEKEKASVLSQDVMKSPVVGELKAENVASSTEPDSSKLKKRGDLKHSRDKSILGITEKLAVANQMRQQKQSGASDSIPKESSSSPKKMPGLIEMGVAKASRRKNLIMKDDQRIFKKTKVIPDSDAVPIKDQNQLPPRQGVEIALGKTEITLSTSVEATRSLPSVQPEIVIAAELPLAEKSVAPSKETGVVLDACAVMDLSSKSVESSKDSHISIKVSDGQTNPADKPSPLSVNKLDTTAALVKEQDRKLATEADKRSVEDYKDNPSFKFPKMKRNTGKEKPVVPSSSAVGPTTRTRAGYKPSTTSPIKVVAKVDDAKEKSNPKVVKREEKQVEVKRKTVEVSTEPFSKPTDGDSKRLEYAEDVLSISTINTPSSGSSSKLLEVIRVAEEKGKDIVKVNDVEVMREPVGSTGSPLSLMRKTSGSSPMFSSISVSTEGPRKDLMPHDAKNFPEGVHTDGPSGVSKFPPGNTESWEFVAKVGEVELLRESPRAAPKPTPPPVTITMEPAVKKPAREKTDSGSRKPGRPSSMPPPSKTPEYTVPMNMLEQAFMAQQNFRNSLEVLVGIGNRPGEGTSMDHRVQTSPLVLQMGSSGMPQWAMPSEAHVRSGAKPTGMETYLAGRKTPVTEQMPEGEGEKRKKGTSKTRNAPPPRWGSQEADKLSVQVDGQPLGTWTPGDWRSLPSVHMWPPAYSGYGPPIRPKPPVEPRCSRSVSPPSHSGRDRRGVDLMPEDLSSPPLPRGRRESPQSFRHPFVHPSTSFPGTPNFTNANAISYAMSKNSSSALNLAKSTSSSIQPSDTAMNLTMCRQPASTPTPPPVIPSSSAQQSSRQNFPVNLVKSRSSSPKTPAQQTQQTLPDGRGAVLPGGIVVPNLPLIFGREYTTGSPSTPPSGRTSQSSAEEGREAGDAGVGQVVRCSSEPPRDPMMERRPRESPILSGFIQTGIPPRTIVASQANQSVQNYPVPRPSSAMSSLELVPTSGASRTTTVGPNLLPGGVVIPNFYGPNGYRPGEEQWPTSGVEGVKHDLPPRSVSSLSQPLSEGSPSKQATPSSLSLPSSTPPPIPPMRTGPGRKGGRAETPPPDKYNFRIEEAHVVMSGGGQGGAGGKLFACDICSGVYRRAFSLKRHYLRAHINYCHLSERDLSNCGIVVGDRMSVTGGSGARRPYVHTTLAPSESKSPEREPEKGSGGRRTLLRDLFRCHTCGVCFDEKRKLKGHLMEHQCGSNRPSLLRQHAAAHHVLPPAVAIKPTPTPKLHPSSPTPTVYLCAYCDKRFSSAAVRRRHRKLHESSPGPHPCYLCETAEDTPETPIRETPSFAQLEDLRSHMASIHKEMYHSCALCGERLPTILALEEHAEEHRSRRKGAEHSDEEEEEEDADLVRAAATAVAPSSESRRQTEGAQAAASTQGEEEEFRYTCGVCQKMFTNYVNMCRHRRLAHGATQTKVVGRKAGAATASKGQSGGRDSESSSRSQSPVVVSQSSERGHRDLLDGEPSSSSSSSVPSPCPYQPTTQPSANDPETLFYTRLASNIRENLLNHLDGKLRKQNSSDKHSKEDAKGTGNENDNDEEVKVEPIWEKYNFPKDFQQMSYWDISTQLVVRNNQRKVNSTPALEPDPEQRPAFPETLALVETSKAGDQVKKEEAKTKEEPEEDVVEGEWSGLSGEWVRPRSYICCACASRFCDLWALEDHKLARHPNVWCTHLEVEDGAIVLPGTPKLSPGSASVAVSFLGDLLCRRPLGPRGALLSAPSVPPTLNNGMESPSARCTKCSRVCPSLPDLHSHMLECGGDLAWAAWAGGSSPAASSRRNSRKWRPFGSRRRRQRGRRGMKRNIPSSPVKMHRARHNRGTDSDSIQRMIANLPAKRATRRVIQFNEDEIKTRSQATIHSVSFSGNFVRVSGYKAPLGVKGAPPTAAKRGRPPKNPVPPTPLNIEGLAVPSTSVAVPQQPLLSGSPVAGGSSPQGAIKKARGRPPGSKSRSATTTPDFTLKRRFGEAVGEAYSPEGDKYGASKRVRPGSSPVNQHPVGSVAPSVPGEPYVCKGCGAVFDNASSCERHGKKCVFRRQTPSAPSSDGIRLTASSGVRPVHACPHCGKNFTYATSMEKHVRVCGSNPSPRGTPVHARRATAPSTVGRKMDEEGEDEEEEEEEEEEDVEEEDMKKDEESQEGMVSDGKEMESQPSEPPQEPDMPQLQKEEPVASPPTKDDDIPVLTPVEPEEEEEGASEAVVVDAVEIAKVDITVEVEEPVVSETADAEVAVFTESETTVTITEEEIVKPVDEPPVEVKEEVVEMPMKVEVEEKVPEPEDKIQVPAEVVVEETAEKAPATETPAEVEERPETPEPEETIILTTGKRTRGSSSGGHVAKKNKVEVEAEEPVVESETPKRKGGKKGATASTRGKSPKGVRSTRGTKGDDDVASEGEEKKEDQTKKDDNAEETACDEVKVKTETEESPIPVVKEDEVEVEKEAPKLADEPESVSVVKEEDNEKEDTSVSEVRGKRGRRGKSATKAATPAAPVSEVSPKVTQEKADSTPVTPRQGKRKGASQERPSSPKTEEMPLAAAPEIEPKVTRGSAQSKGAASKDKEITKDDKGKSPVSKKEEEVTVAAKEKKGAAVEKPEEEPAPVVKEMEEEKHKGAGEVKPEESEEKDEAKEEEESEKEEEEEEDEDDGKDSKLRGTKGPKGKVSKKISKKKKKQEVKKVVENFWCEVCEMSYSSAFNLVKHGMSRKHQNNLKLAQEKKDASKESVEGEKSKDKKGGDEEEGPGEGKMAESAKKGGKSGGKEGENTLGKGKESEKTSAPKSSDGGKGDREKKDDGEGKTSKKKSDGDLKGKESNEAASGKEKSEKGDTANTSKVDSCEKSSPQDKKGKSATSESDGGAKTSSAKEKPSPEKKSPEKKTAEKKSEKKSPEKKTQEKNLTEKNQQPKNLTEKNLQEKNLQEKNLQEKNLQEKNLQEKRSSEKKTPEKKAPEKKTPEKKSPEKKSGERKPAEKKPPDLETREGDEEEKVSKKDNSSKSMGESEKVDASPPEASKIPPKEDQVKTEVQVRKEVVAPVTVPENASSSRVIASDLSQPEGSKAPVPKDIADSSLIGQTASEREKSEQGDNQPAPAQEAESSITKVSPEATVAAAPESATVIEGTKNGEGEAVAAWPETPAVAPSQEFAQPLAPPPSNYNMMYEWSTGVVPQQVPPPPPAPPSAMPPQQPSITTQMHPTQQLDSWGVYGGWEAPITDPNPPPSPGLWRYQPPNPIPWTDPQHSLSPIPRVPSYEDPTPVAHPSTPNPSPPNPSLGSILDSVNRILGEDVPGFDSSRMQAGATAPEEEYGGVGLFGEGLAELQRAMGATDEEMAMLQQLGTGPLDFVYDNNAMPTSVPYSAIEHNDQTGPLPNPELVDLDNQSAAVTIGGDGPIEEAESTALPSVAADSSSYYGDGRGGKRKRCGPPPSKCKKIAPPPRESNRGWRGGRRLLPAQASLASAHLLISQYEKKEMVCPMCNRHFLGLAALETHVAWVHKVKDAKQHILEGATDGQPCGKKSNPAASNTLRELVAGRGVGGVVVGGGVTSSPTPSRRLPCFVCKELYSDVISLNHHIAQQHLRRRPGEGGSVPEMDGNLKSQMTSALGGLLGKALANMRSRSDANATKPTIGLPAMASKSSLYSPFPKLNLLTKSLDAISKMSSGSDGSIRKSFSGPSCSDIAGDSYDASSDSPEVSLFRRDDGVDPSEWSSDGEDSAKGQEAEAQLEEGEIPSFHHICQFCGDRFQRLSSKNRHITWAHRDMTCMDVRLPRSCSHENSDFDELLGRGRKDESGDGSSTAKEDSEDTQETGRRHNHHPCPACQLTFLRHSQLETHLKRAHNGIADSPLPDTSDSMMECPICRESMNNFLKLCKHVKTKHREWSINCFTTDMHHHLILRKESPEESMVIRKKFLVKMKAFPVLRMASPTPSSRSSEEESYMDPDPKGNYLCSVCGVNFKSPQGVIRHLNLEHNSNHLEGALPLQKIFPRHATKEFRSRVGSGLGSDIKAKAEAALRELNLSQKLKLGAMSSGKGFSGSKVGQSRKSSASALDGSNDLGLATTSKGTGRGRGGSRRGRGKRGGARGGMASDIEKSLFDVYEFEDDDDDLEETPSRVGSADGSSRVGSECGDDEDDDDGAEDDGKSGSAASIRAKRASVDSSSSDAKYSCNACGKGYKSLTAFWKHGKGIRGSCSGGGSSPARSGDHGSTEGSSGPSMRSGSKGPGGRGKGGKEEDEGASSDVESEAGGTMRVLRRLRGSTSGASDHGGAEGSVEASQASEATEAAPKRAEKGGGRGGKGRKKGGGGGASVEEEKKPLFSGVETVRTYGGKRTAKQQAEERRGRGGAGDDGDGPGAGRRSLGASEAAFDALRGGGSS